MRMFLEVHDHRPCPLRRRRQHFPSPPIGRLARGRIGSEKGKGRSQMPLPWRFLRVHARILRAGGEDLSCLGPDCASFFCRTAKSTPTAWRQGRRRVTSCIAILIHLRVPSLPTRTPPVLEFSPLRLTPIQSLPTSLPFMRRTMPMAQTLYCPDRRCSFSIPLLAFSCTCIVPFRFPPPSLSLP